MSAPCHSRGKSPLCASRTNAQSFADQGAGILKAAACERLTVDSRAALERYVERLEARKRQGFVRECHGDLHLRNICLVDGLPTLFDGVEFNDEISCTDVPGKMIGCT